MDLSEHSGRILHAVRELDFDLSEHPNAEREVPQDPKLGHAGVARPVLGLADYVDPNARKVPAAVHRSHLEFPWGALLNDSIGDCGEAMAIHGIEAFHLDAGTAVPPFGDPQAEKAYEDVGGYVPGDPSTDKGTDNQTLVDYWRDVGILDAAGQRHTIAGSLFIPPHRIDLTKLGIWEFVAVFRAIGLPITAQGQRRWRVTDPSLQGPAAPGSWGYHDIPYFSFDAKCLRNVSWGVPMLVDWPFDLAYAVQGIVVVTHEQTNLRGISPSGIDWTQLNADLAKFPPASA